MSAQERGIEQEVVAPAGAPSPPADRDETAHDEAARDEAAAATGAGAARPEAAAAQAGPGAAAEQPRAGADAAQAGPFDADAVGSGSGADAAQAGPFDADAVAAGSGADAADSSAADADAAGPRAGTAEAGPSDAVAAGSGADAAQAEALEEPDDEARADLHERAGRADAYLELAQRTQADFDNYRKRMTREVRAAEARGIGRLARELLPAIDNLERALAAVETAEPRHHLSEGIRLVTAELSAALGRTGIQGYDPKGERFDPVEHEAVAQHPVAGAEPGTVVEVLQAGYRLNEAILRPARVIVAS
jgi:molecular chaperone GrpE